TELRLKPRRLEPFSGSGELRLLPVDAHHLAWRNCLRQPERDGSRTAPAVEQAHPWFQTGEQESSMTLGGTPSHEVADVGGISWRVRLAAESMLGGNRFTHGQHSKRPALPPSACAQV